MFTSHNAPSYLPIRFYEAFYEMHEEAVSFEPAVAEQVEDHC